MGALRSYIITDYSTLCWILVERVHYRTSPEVLVYLSVGLDILRTAVTLLCSDLVIYVVLVQVYQVDHVIGTPQCQWFVENSSPTNIFHQIIHVVRNWH